MKLHFILALLMALFIMSCNKQNSLKLEMGRVEFSFDSIASKLVDTSFRYDSLFIDRVNKDSLVIMRYLGGEGYHYYSQFSLKNRVFYENRIEPFVIIEGETETYAVLIPTFSVKDTIFRYIVDDDFTPFFVPDLGFDKCNYEIKKANNELVTIKQSLVDTTYKEIYYYDQNFNIYKYINTWKDNKCVYVRKE